MVEFPFPAARPSARRELLRAGALAGFALAVQPVAVATILTPPDGLQVGPIEIPAGDRSIPGYHARPEGKGSWPVILVVQEIFGVHEHIRDVCRRFARSGYLAVAPDLYVRQGDVSRLPAIADIMPIVAAVPDQQVMSDLDAAADWAQAHGGNGHLAVTGFCWGGRITWLYAAHNPAVGAAVAWYGRVRGQATSLQPRHPIDVVAELKAPVLGLYGGRDEGIPLADLELMRSALKAAGKAAEIHVYPEAPHGFHADYRPSYREAEARDGWTRCLRWLAMHGVAS